MTASRKLLTAYMVFLHVLLIALMAEVYLLVAQNRSLKIKGTMAYHLDLAQLVRVGDTLPAFPALTMQGLPEFIAYDDSTKTYLVLVFNTTCPACKDNIPNWHQLAAGAHPSRCMVRGVSFHKLTATQKYVSELDLRFPVIVPLDSTFVRHYKPNAIPQTLLLGYGGVVKRIWLGILSEQDKLEIIRMLS